MCPQATIVLLLTSGACASYALLRNRIKDTLARKVTNGCLMFALRNIRMIVRVHKACKRDKKIDAVIYHFKIPLNYEPQLNRVLNDELF